MVVASEEVLDKNMEWLQMESDGFASWQQIHIYVRKENLTLVLTHLTEQLSHTVVVVGHRPIRYYTQIAYVKLCCVVSLVWCSAV